MKKLALATLAILLVGAVLVSGFAAAQGGPAAAPADRPGDGTRPMDGSNSPWVTDDERLDVFQERFDLTDEQMAEIREAVLEKIDEGADREEIRDTVLAKLAAFGVEDPELGPYADRDRPRAGGNGPGNARGDAPADGFGNQYRGHGHGPWGPADGTGPNCPRQG
jgi:hypothetical protein